MFCFVQVLQEIFQTEDKIMMLERSMKAKENPLKVFKHTFRKEQKDFAMSTSVSVSKGQTATSLPSSATQEQKIQ